MSEDGMVAAAKLAAFAAFAGAGARVMLALHSGVRRVGLLGIESGVGAALGIIAGGFVAWWEPSVLGDSGRATLMISGAAGACGALGTRLLDFVTAFLQRRSGGQ